MYYRLFLGRRPLLMAGGLLMAVALLLLAFIPHSKAHHMSIVDVKDATLSSFQLRPSFFSIRPAEEGGVAQPAVVVGLMVFVAAYAFRYEVCLCIGGFLLKSISFFRSSPKRKGKKGKILHFPPSFFLHLSFCMTGHFHSLQVLALWYGCLSVRFSRTMYVGLRSEL